jgi:signal transduction histidine kinase
MVANACLGVLTEIAASDIQLARDGRQLGRILKDLVENSWPVIGEENTLRLIADANQEKSRVRIRWVWLEDDAPPAFRPVTTREERASAPPGMYIQLKKSNAEGTNHFYTYAPVDVMPNRPCALELRMSLARHEEMVRRTVVRTAAAVVIAAVAMTVLVAAFGLTLLGQPLNQLIQRTRRIGHGDLNHDPAFRGRDELGEMGKALDTMCDQLAQDRQEILSQTEARITALEQLRHADRLKTVGQLASGIAHELGTPLNIITGRLELIKADERCGSELTMHVDIIKSQCEGMTGIIGHLLDFARRRAPKRTLTDLSHLVRDVLEFLRPMMKKRGVELRVTGLDDTILAEIDGAQIQQVITNIVVNGIHAMRNGGLLEVAIGREVVSDPTSPTDEKVHPYVEVSDQGQGIAPSELEQIFDPFFSTKDVGEGTGLGLSIALGIVKEHGGWISVNSQVGRGSRFRIYLPEEVKLCPVAS